MGSWFPGSYVKLLFFVNAAVFARGFNDGRRLRAGRASRPPLHQQEVQLEASDPAETPVPAEKPKVGMPTAVKLLKTEA